MNREDAHRALGWALVGAIIAATLFINGYGGLVEMWSSGAAAVQQGERYLP